MAFGQPARYLQLSLNRIDAIGSLTDERVIWDKAVEQASDEYKTHTVILINLRVLFFDC